MNLKKKISTQIARYYDDLEKNRLELGDEMSAELQEDRLYTAILQGIARSEKPKYALKKMMVAACIAISVCALGILGYQQLQQTSSKQQQVIMRTAFAAKNRVVQVTLVDGTQIWLNSGSTLNYPQAFNGNTREVSLQGEAYFQVAHNASKPFIIHSEQLSTKVLGTSFNIKAYREDEYILVAVLTGKVELSHPVLIGKQIDSISITPDQQVTYNKKKQKMSLEKVKKASDMISWREGRLLYDETPLKTVVTDLQRKYGVVIAINPELEKRKITADFHQESIKKVMVILSEMTESKMVQTKEGFLLH